MDHVFQERSHFGSLELFATGLQLMVQTFERTSPMKSIELPPSSGVSESGQSSVVAIRESSRFTSLKRRA